ATFGEGGNGLVHSKGRDAAGRDGQGVWLSFPPRIIRRLSASIVSHTNMDSRTSSTARRQVRTWNSFASAGNHVDARVRRGRAAPTALICPPMEIGRLHGGDTCPNPPQRKMTFLLRLQFRPARFLLTRPFARKDCGARPGVLPSRRRRTARSRRWPARLSSHRSISFRHWRRQFSTSPSVILPASVC